MTVYVPAGVAASTALPVVVNLHGTQGTGAGQLQYSNMAPAADAGKFLVVAPTGVIPVASGFAWNVPGVGTAPAGARDDVGFLEQVITTATASLCGDPARVYGTGYSGGGRMMSAFACLRAHRVAAIAPVAGLRAGRPDPADTSRPDPQSCVPGRAVPVVAFHGQQDTTNPYQAAAPSSGATPCRRRSNAGPSSTAAPPAGDHPAGRPRVQDRLQRLPRHRRRPAVHRLQRRPHLARHPDRQRHGTVTHEIDANSIMWQFFQQHRL